MAKKAEDMVVASGVRYKRSVAERLGLIRNAKVVTARSRQVGTTTTAAVAKAQAEAAAKAEAEAEVEAPDERPADSATKKIWTAYALANGQTEESLEGLKRDDIAALFPAEPSDEDEDEDDDQ